MDRFHLTPWDIARLTPFQVHELYFHKRDKDGSIEIPGGGGGFQAPQGPHTLEMELEFIDALAIFGKLPQDKVDAAKDALRAKYAEAERGESVSAG